MKGSNSTQIFRLLFTTSPWTQASRIAALPGGSGSHSGPAPALGDTYYTTRSRTVSDPGATNPIGDRSALATTEDSRRALGSVACATPSHRPAVENCAPISVQNE
jgi:hypothetical protein